MCHFWPVWKLPSPHICFKKSTTCVGSLISTKHMDKYFIRPLLYSFANNICTIQTIYETWSINHRRGKFLSIIFEFLTWKMVAFLLKSRANFSSVKQTKKRNRSVEACRCTTCFWNVLIGFPNPFYGSQLRFITSKLISGGLLYCLLKGVFTKPCKS